MSEAAPDEYGFGKSLNVQEDGGTRGGKAGNALEERVHEAVCRARKEEGKCTEKTDYDPGERNYEESVSRIKLGVLWLPPGEEPVIHYLPKLQQFAMAKQKSLHHIP